MELRHPPTPDPRESPERIAARALVTPAVLAAAWDTWHVRHRGQIGPGPAFSEAIEAALAALIRDEVILVCPVEEPAPAPATENDPCGS